MLCPYCFDTFEEKDRAPSLTGGEPCVPAHCSKAGCFLECPECADWLEAISTGGIYAEKLQEAKAPVKADITYLGRDPKLSWPKLVVSEAFVEKMRLLRLELNKKWTDNYLSENSPHRHHGHVGEGALKFWFDAEGIVAPCTVSTAYKDIYDFKWNGMTINAKTTTNKAPELKPFHANNVAKLQHEKHNCDGYIFLHFNPNTRELWIVGWSTWEKFDKLKVYREKGVPVTPSYTPNTSHYENKISQCTPIEVLTEIPIGAALAEPKAKAPTPAPKLAPAQGDIPW
jgi:hypothetical protein